MSETGDGAFHGEERNEREVDPVPVGSYLTT